MEKLRTRKLEMRSELATLKPVSPDVFEKEKESREELGAIEETIQELQRETGSPSPSPSNLITFFTAKLKEKRSGIERDRYTTMKSLLNSLNERLTDIYQTVSNGGDCQIGTESSSLNYAIEFSPSSLRYPTRFCFWSYQTLSSPRIH